jgi:hypothetical protein
MCSKYEIASEYYGIPKVSSSFFFFRYSSSYRIDFPMLGHWKDLRLKGLIYLVSTNVDKKEIQTCSSAGRRLPTLQTWKAL